MFERCKDLGLLLGKGGACTDCAWPPGLGCLAVRVLPLREYGAWCAPAHTSPPRCAAAPPGTTPPPSGLHGNVFRIKPPMCWTKADADFCAAVLDQALSEL